MATQRKNPISIALILLVLLVWAAHAEVPQLVNVQGLLTDGFNEPIADGSYSVTFALYDVQVAGTALWTETRTVETVDGLFTIVLGESNPLSESLFTGNAELYLGITVAGDSEMTPRQRLTSVPYALTTPEVGGSGSGWVSDGDVVYLENDSNYVGIGTDSPNWKLDVGGDVRAADSLIGGNMRLGTASSDGGLKLFGDQTPGPFLEIGERYDGGGNFKLQAANGEIAVAIEVNNINGGAGQMWLARKDGRTGISMAGGSGSVDEPRLEFSGHSGSILLTLGEEGDYAAILPDGSISNLETGNEAGLANDNSTTQVTLNNSVKDIASIRITSPTAGYVLVIASCDAMIDHVNGVTEEMYLGISDQSGVLPASNYAKTYRTTMPSGHYHDPVTIHRVFEVNIGSKYFYLTGKEHLAHSWVDDIQITAVFLPTWYGQIVIPGAAEEGGEIELESSAATQPLLERMIEERVQQETKAIEDRFAEKLAALKAELQAETK